MRTDNLAVMLTDMKGFTAATSRQTRAENARMLALQDALLLPVVRAFGGVRVKTIGDASLILFPSPTYGLLCGTALQDRLWDYNRRAAETERIEVRIVLSLGEVRLEGSPARPSDVYGEAVNLVARVEAEAEAGEVWFTEAVRLVADPREAPSEEVGLRALKGFPEPVRLFRAARTGSGVEEPPYGGAALARVAGLALPEPAQLARAVRRRENPFLRSLAAIRDAAMGMSFAAVGLALLLLLAAVAGAVLWWRDPVRLIDEGRFAQAASAIDSRAARLGPEAPRILYLRGRLEAARADADAGGRIERAFHLWSRALAKGSGDARAALAAEVRSPACFRRVLAARALVDSRSEAARGPLEELSLAERPAEDGLPEEGARCGAGDVARDGLAGLGEIQGR
jgi:class 3 adenylate cyclase